MANDKLQAGTSEARMRELFQVHVGRTFYDGYVPTWLFYLRQDGQYERERLRDRFDEWKVAFTAGREEGLREALEIARTTK